MYAETPVVATAVGGVPEAVRDGETGFLVSLGDSEEMGDRISFLLSNTSKRRQMGAAALQLARDRFSKESWISEYATLLDDLAKSRES
jgi:glycosyltransferase involved in cell wall biosynthesis